MERVALDAAELRKVAGAAAVAGKAVGPGEGMVAVDAEDTAPEVVRSYIGFEVAAAVGDIAEDIAGADSPDEREVPAEHLVPGAVGPARDTAEDIVARGIPETEEEPAAAEGILEAGHHTDQGQTAGKGDIGTGLLAVGPGFLSNLVADSFDPDPEAGHKCSLVRWPHVSTLLFSGATFSDNWKGMKPYGYERPSSLPEDSTWLQCVVVTVSCQLPTT